MQAKNSHSRDIIHISLDTQGISMISYPTITWTLKGYHTINWTWISYYNYNLYLDTFKENQRL